MRGPATPLSPAARPAGPCSSPPPPEPGSGPRVRRAVLAGVRLGGTEGRRGPRLFVAAPFVGSRPPPLLVILSLSPSRPSHPSPSRHHLQKKKGADEGSGFTFARGRLRAGGGELRAESSASLPRPPARPARSWAGGAGGPGAPPLLGTRGFATAPRACRAL